MSFRVLDALPILVTRFGETVNKVPRGREREGLENKKAMAFRTSAGKVLALDVYPSSLHHVRLWIESPAPPRMPDLSILTWEKCDDLRRRELAALADGRGLYFEAETRPALEALLDWYS